MHLFKKNSKIHSYGAALYFPYTATSKCITYHQFEHPVFDSGYCNIVFHSRVV